MAMKTHHGGCHCGAVAYEVDIDLSKGTMRCNCSLCSKARAWFAFAPASSFRLLKGEEHLADYQWTPPGKPRPNLHYRFCETCGVRVFASGQDRSGNEMRGIAVASIEDADPNELAGSIKYVDGRHDQFTRAPEDTRLL
jgi:hypothetical protein